MAENKGTVPTIVDSNIEPTAADENLVAGITR